MSFPIDRKTTLTTDVAPRHVAATSSEPFFNDRSYELWQDQKENPQGIQMAHSIATAHQEQQNYVTMCTIVGDVCMVAISWARGGPHGKFWSARVHGRHGARC